MRKIYFVRHAKPDFSIVDDYSRPLTALSTVINYFNNRFDLAEFHRIKNIMPLIVCLTFDVQDFIEIEEFILE